MAEAHDRNKIFREILDDAGICGELSEQCMCCFESRDTEHLLRCLSVRRNKILEDIHRGQKQIDCLDFLAYKIRNENE